MRARTFTPLALVLCLTTVATAQISYPDFSSTTGMVLNGSAAQQGNILRMTPAVNNQAATAWYQSRVPVTAGFFTSFAFQISPGGADGMTFIVHDDPAGTAALASGGGSLGYTSEPVNPMNTMVNLLVIEIDNWQNGNMGDPNNNHISVHLMPTLPTTTNGADEFYSIAQATPPFTLADGLIHTMCISYVPGTLEIYLDNSPTALISVPFDFATGGTNLTGVPLAGLTLTNGSDAYVGFSAGTGGFNQTNDVLAWTFGAPGCGTLIGPYETNDSVSSLDLDGLQGTSYSNAVSIACIGGTSTMNATGTPGQPSDIVVAVTAAVPSFLTTPGGQQVNVDFLHPSAFGFNGGTPTFAGILNLQPHPGTITFSAPTTSTYVASAQQLVTDPAHMDGFQLSQPIEINVQSASGPQTLSLGDDNFIQVIMAGTPYCGSLGVTFYGTVYNDFFVESNGTVNFVMGSGDFTASSGEWQTLMPRIGIQSDLQPNVYGTVTVTNNGAAGVGDWFSVAYQNVTEWGTGGLGVTSYTIELHGPSGHEIAGFTTDGTWGTTPVVGGITLGGGGTHPPLVSFDTLFGTGLQANVNATDSVIDENTGGMLINTNAWSSIQFPLFDGSAFIVQ